MKKLGLILGMIMVFMLAPSVLGASITSCGSVPSGVHTLDNDISINTASDCLILTNDTIIDGQGYTIYGNNSILSSTVTPLTNVTIYNVNLVKNGTAIGTSAGAFTGIANNIHLENITISQTEFGAGWGFNGLRICGTEVVTATCSNITYDNITINTQDIPISLGGASITLDGNVMNDIYANVTSSGGHGAIWVVKPTNAVMSNIQVYSNQVGIEITDAGSGVEMSNITIFSASDGLQLTSDDISVTNATITSGGDGIFIGTGADNITLNDINITTTGAGHGIFTYALGVLDLTIDGLYIDGNNVDTNYGIYNVVGFNVNINDFVIMNYGGGILFYQSSGLTVTNGQFFDMNITGNLSNLTSSGGAISIYSSNNTRIENVYVNNTLTSGFSYIALSTPPLRPSENHELINVTVNCAGLCGQEGRGSPISLLGVKNLTVSESTFSNGSTGVFSTAWFSWMDYREDIWFYNNTFLNNVLTHVLINTTATNVNFNDSAYGNSWDDYIGCDMTGGGVGSTPYVINETIGIYDFLPSTSTLCVPVLTVSPSINTTITSLPYIMNITTSYGVLNCTWDTDGSGNTSMTNTSNMSWSGEVTISDGTYQVEFYCEGDNGEFGYDNSVWLTYSSVVPPTPIVSTNPILALVPFVIGIAMLLLFVGALSTSLELDTMVQAIVLFVVALAFIGVIYLL